MHIVIVSMKFSFIYMISMNKVYAVDVWIKADQKCMTNWSCSLDIYKTLWIRQTTEWQNSAELFVQDGILAATFFIGTLAAIWLIASGLMMVFWWANESSYEKWKQWVKYSIIGILLVILSYTAIRAVQFIAQWN